jgi:ADP-ribose pyrophosphatase YjhB (NUDIX family)
MRRRRRLRVADLPRLLVGGAVGLAGLLSGRYARIEGANVLATDDAGRILVVRPLYGGGEWMLPGGRVERDETPHVAAAREAREETGLEVVVERLVLVDAHQPHDVSFVFAGRVVGGGLEPQLGEISEVGWVDREEIARTAPGLERLLRHIDVSPDGVAYLGWG